MYWTLLATNSVGRIQTEKLGKKAVTTRTYFEAKNRVKSIATTAGLTTVQDLSYNSARRDD